MKNLVPRYVIWNAPVNKIGQLLHRSVYHWWAFGYLGGKVSPSVTSDKAEVCDVSVCHVVNVSPKDFFLLSLKILFSLTQKNSVCTLVFCQTFSKNILSEKKGKKIPPSIFNWVRGQKKKKLPWMFNESLFINCMKSSLNKLKKKNWISFTGGKKKIW